MLQQWSLNPDRKSPPRLHYNRTAGKRPRLLPVAQHAMSDGVAIGEQGSHQSNLYGNVDSVSESLRSGIGGQMHMDSYNILATNDNGAWISGDSRFGQTPLLASLHSIHQREHNRIAKILEGINPHWTDKRLFEETRRIVIGQFQHMIYEEFLPAFISPNIMRYMDLPDVAATLGAITFHEFNTAIFRVMHSFIPTDIRFIAEDGTNSTRKFHSLVVNAQLLKTHYDDITRGMLMQPVHSDGYHPDLFQGVFARSADTHGYEFIRLKTADPYFYTNQIPLINPKPFTSAQLREIKKANTNQLYCLNSGVGQVPKESGFAPTSAADVVSCDTLPQISYESWRTTSP